MRKKKKSFVEYLTPILLILLVSAITVGYSAFVASLSVINTVAYVREETNVRISNVTTMSSGIANIEFSPASIVSTVSIPANSSVTYTITMVNLGNRVVSVAGASFTKAGTVTNDLTTPITVANYVKICYDNMCTNGISKTFDMVVNNTTSNSIVGQMVIYLDIRELFTVTYENSVIGNEVLAGETFNYTFPSSPPSSVTVLSGTCGTATMSGSTLTVTNVTSDIVLEGSSNGSGTWADPYIISDNTYHYNDLDAASYKFVNLSGEPEITVDSNHKVTKYELTNCGSGLAMSQPIETGILAFDNESFTINLDITVNLGNNANYYKHIISALVAKTSTTYSGFLFTNYKSGRMYVYRLSGSSISSSGYGGYQLYYFSLTGKYANKDTRYTIQMTFDTSSENLRTVMDPGSVDEEAAITTIPDEMRNATITIGGNGINTNNNLGSYTVHSLSITKG